MLQFSWEAIFATETMKDAQLNLEERQKQYFSLRTEIIALKLKSNSPTQSTGPQMSNSISDTNISCCSMLQA